MTTISASSAEVNVTALAIHVAIYPTDTTSRLVYADALEDAGHTEEATRQRDIANGVQSTEEGEQVVTVARDGADHDSYGNGIYVTAFYTATRRKKDGKLTWRRTGSCNDRTAGKKVTRPMEERAEAVALARGLEYVEGVRHGHVCP